jgi:aspartyl-tRNA synthetase
MFQVLGISHQEAHDKFGYLLEELTYALHRMEELLLDSIVW